MFYTGAAVTDEGQLRQQIGLAISTDLSSWHKDDRTPLVRNDSRQYEQVGGPTRGRTNFGVTPGCSRTPTDTARTCCSPPGPTPNDGRQGPPALLQSELATRYGHPRRPP